MTTELIRAPPAGPARRSDAGRVRFTARDAAGLILTGDMYAAPYDLLGQALDVRPDRLRAITTRWRAAGLAESGRIGPGPGWCWLTRGRHARRRPFASRPAGTGDRPAVPPRPDRPRSPVPRSIVKEAA